MNATNREVNEIYTITQTGKSYKYYTNKGRNYIQENNYSDFSKPRKEDSVDVRLSISDLIVDQAKISYYLPDNFMEDRSICKSVVIRNPEYLGIFNANVRDDDKVILECLKGSITKEKAIYWSYVSPRLRQRKWLRDLAFKKCKYIFKYFTPKQKADDKMGKSAFMSYPELFSELSPKLQNDWKIVAYYIDTQNKTLEDLDRMGYSKELISKIGTASTKDDSIMKLYQFGIPKNTNPPKTKLRKI